MADLSQQDLKNFFLFFSAEHSLTEADTEKLERVLHELQPKNLEEVKKISTFIIEKEILKKPEDEIVDLLKSKFKKRKGKSSAKFKKL